MARFFTQASSNFISLGNSATLNPANITLAAWFYWGGGLTGNGFEAWMITRDDNTLGRAYGMGIANGGIDPSFFWQINGSNEVVLSIPGGTGGSYHNSWHHLAATGPGSGYRLYLDGALVGSPGSTTAMNATTGATRIGARSYSLFQGFFDGRLADTVIYNAVLTSLEIAALAKGIRPSQIRPNARVADLPLFGLASPEPDLSGNAFNGTLTGTALAFGPPVTMFTPRWPQKIEVAAAAAGAPFIFTPAIIP